MLVSVEGLSMAPTTLATLSSRACARGGEVRAGREEGRVTAHGRALLFNLQTSQVATTEKGVHA